MAIFFGSSQSFLIRLLEDGAKDTHSEALLRAYSVAGNIYFCPEMSRGDRAKEFVKGLQYLIVHRDWGSSAWRGEGSTELVFFIPRQGLIDVKNYQYITQDSWVKRTCCKIFHFKFSGRILGAGHTCWALLLKQVQRGPALPCTAAGKGHQSALLIQRQRRRHRQRLRLRQSVSALPGPAGEKRHQFAISISKGLLTGIWIAQK